MAIVQGRRRRGEGLAYPGPVNTQDQQPATDAAETREPDTAGGGTWLSVPQAAQRLGVRDRDVRSMMREKVLVGVRRDGGRGPQIPAATIVEIDGAAQPLPSLHGTLVTLADCGLDESESVEWLTSPQDELGTTPLEALLSGRTRAVRQVARMLL